ncbi:peptide chain release factor N(5)-glutamine methyltransferase [Candidatus Dependentiae bacterium]|nr:peptide chain release factor N(5)-glutamine methyltransferase [Candidatus Dependentiae bacterium]
MVVYMKYKIENILEKITKQILPACKSKHEAEQQAKWLLEELTQKKYAHLVAQKEFSLNEKQEKKLNEWINLRVNEKKPIQYIIGYIPFLNLKIKTKPPILIPRPETEEWTNWLIKKLKDVKINTFPKEIRILDIGTGSGCIALSLAKNLPDSFVIGTDINPKAIELAQENKILNNVENVKFMVSNFYNNLDSEYKFDIIVSNPPYICEYEWDNLDETIKKWEDKKALVANKDCLHAYKIIISEAKSHLRENYNLEKDNIDRIFLEIGENQSKDIKILFVKNTFKNISFFKDLEGKQRVISARF